VSAGTSIRVRVIRSDSLEGLAEAVNAVLAEGWRMIRTTFCADPCDLEKSWYQVVGWSQDLPGPGE